MQSKSNLFIPATSTLLHKPHEIKKKASKIKTKSGKEKKIEVMKQE